MTTQPHHISDWPHTVHTDATGHRWIEGANGERMEMQVFKDTCHQRAVELRAQAMNDAMDAVAQAVRLGLRAASHHMRSALARSQWAGATKQ